MTLTWPIPRSRVQSSPYFPEMDALGGPAAAADLVRLGVLTPLFDGAFGLQDARTPDMRALAVASYVSNGAIVGMDAAAWIHTGIGNPRKVFVWQSRSRHRLSPSRRRIVRSRELTAEDVVHIAGVPVTSPLRTLRDIEATSSPNPHQLAALDEHVR